MRIHQLTFQAIGPYASAQHLDFAHLDHAGLFLLDGPTGAGKSTILDAITFALYGKANDDRKNTELPSTLAAPGTPPTIELDVSFGNRRFLIDRTLQHQAPRRGAKTPDDVVTRQASMTLVELVNGQRRQLTTRVDEAQQILRDVIGLSREQFTSVVLLPQGDFARFLKASSNDREAILRQLFNTHRFDAIGDYLVAQAKQLRGTVDADTARRNTLRAGLIATAQQHTESASLESSETLEEFDDAQLVTHVDGIMTALASQAQRRVEQATTTYQTARNHFHTLQQQREYVTEATAYRKRRTAHTDQTSRHDNATRALAHHDRARAVVDMQHHLDAARTTLDAALTTLQDHCNAANQSNIIIQWAQAREIFTADETRAQELADQWKTVESTAIRALEHVAQHEKTQALITAGQRRVAHWRTTAEQLTKTIADLDERFETLSAELTANRARAEELSGVDQLLTAANQQLEDATARQAAAHKARRAQATVDAAQTTRTTAREHAEQALESAQELLRRRIDAAAGFLAEKLEPGQPCEVCGATTHPHPATTHELTDVSNDAVQQAEHRATQARRAANEADAEYQTTLQTFQTLQTEAGGLTVDQAQAAVTAAQDAVATAKSDVATLSDLRARGKAQESQAEQLRQQRADAQQQHTEITTQMAGLTDETQHLQRDLTAALGSFETVEALRAAVEPAHRLVTHLTHQAAVVATAVTTHATAADGVTQALDQSATDEHPAFHDADEARSHVLDPDVHTEYETFVHQWETEQARLAEKAGQHAVIAGLQLLDDGVEAPSDAAVAAADAAQRDAEAHMSAANRHHGTIHATRAQCVQQQQQLTELSKRSAAQRARYEALVGLSDVVAGQGENAAKMPLRSFVLAGWLEQVAANASERLTGMTGGRYELQHTVGEGGRGHAGLNLQVIDHLNDTARTPSTLSGGETFMASLALALGLADAVQAQAGGVAMDTLFIDEGFGSLDAETLEEVMEVLATLQDDGRLIGLVSHVESMKQQIPHRIQVQKTPTGSSVHIIGPDLA